MFGIDDAAMGAIISGGMQAGGSLLGGMIGSAGQAAANAQNWQNQMTMFDMQQRSIPAAQLQAQDWNQMMRSTAYQHTMEDMRKAGLNPILAASLGPTGSAGSPAMMTPGSAPQMGNVGAPMGAGVASASQAAQSAAATKVALTQADKDTSQTKLNDASTGLTKANETLAGEATKRTTQETATSAATEDAQKAQAAAARAQAAVAAANVGLILQQTNSATSQARIDQKTAEDVERFGVPRNESIPQFIGRVLRGQAPPQPSSAKTVTPSTGSSIEIKPKDWGSWDPRNWFK